MATVNTSLSVIILNMNGLKSPIKRPRAADGLKKNPAICYLGETNFRYNDIHRLKSEMVKKDIPCKW